MTYYMGWGSLLSAAASFAGSIEECTHEDIYLHSTLSHWTTFVTLCHKLRHKLSASIIH